MICVDMEMPENCNACPFHDWEYYVCLAPGNGNQDEDVMAYNTTRHPKCPLIDFGEYMQDPVTKLLQEYKERVIGSDTNP